MANAELEGSRLGGHAVVLGSSMAGLLAARVLASHFAQVTLIEHDHLPDGPEYRRGVPQAKHGHVLLGRGASVLEELFPGLTEDLLSHGAIPLDPARDGCWFQGGVRKVNFPSDLRALGCSRLLVEWRTRTHLLRLPNVRVRENLLAHGLLADRARQRVVGVELLDGSGGGEPERLEADLVVDATGRGTRTPHWLEVLGFTGLETSVVSADVGYASRIYRVPTPPPDWKYLLMLPRAPDKRLGVILPIEGGRWMATLTGYHGVHPPADEAGYLAYVRAMEQPDYAEALRHAEPLSDIATFRIPSSVRRHYERMPRFPEGFIVLGDAACTFNPIYGQGMTTSALGAAALQDCLVAQARSRRGLAGFSRRFQKVLARVTQLPWQAVASEDFRYSETTGPKAFGAEVMNWYIGRIHRLCAKDPRVTRQFLGVMHMLDSPAALFHPSTVLKVLFSREAAPSLPPPRSSTLAEA
ncbi:hypothetical protein P2318_16410 [Myxococcaceae bacterium GXIMD 01537]